MESFRISSGKLGSSRRVVILRASVAHLPSQLAAFRHHKLPAKNPLSKPSLGTTPPNSQIQDPKSHPLKSLRATQFDPP